MTGASNSSNRSWQQGSRGTGSFGNQSQPESPVGGTQEEIGSRPAGSEALPALDRTSVLSITLERHDAGQEATFSIRGSETASTTPNKRVAPLDPISITIGVDAAVVEPESMGELEPVVNAICGYITKGATASAFDLVCCGWPVVDVGNFEARAQTVADAAGVLHSATGKAIELLIGFDSPLTTLAGSITAEFSLPCDRLFKVAKRALRIIGIWVGIASGQPFVVLACVKGEVKDQVIEAIKNELVQGFTKQRAEKGRTDEPQAFDWVSISTTIDVEPNISLRALQKRLEFGPHASMTIDQAAMQQPEFDKSPQKQASTVDQIVSDKARPSHDPFSKRERSGPSKSKSK